MATPYQIVAKAALINWNGLSDEEATTKIQTESVQTLDRQVDAMSSIKYAVIGIAKQLLLNEEETLKFTQAVIYGPENAEIFNVVRDKAKGFSDEQILEVLATIHDGWVINKSDEVTFKTKFNKQRLRQYAPLELIGWNEVKNDLLFLGPILTAIDVKINEEALAEAYYNRVSNYMEENKINSLDKLTLLVQQGRQYYPIMPEELEVRLTPISETVSSQIIQNWNENDKKTAQIFEIMQQNKSTGSRT